MADLKGDGYPDIAACPAYLGCFVYFNNGKGNFAPGIQFQKPDPVELAGKEEERMPYSMTAADLNGDGRLDLVVGYVDAPGVVYYTNGTGNTFASRPFGDGKRTIYGMASRDLEGDGQNRDSSSQERCTLLRTLHQSVEMNGSNLKCAPNTYLHPSKTALSEGSTFKAGSSSMVSRWVCEPSAQDGVMEWFDVRAKART